jgi:uncharacterized protein (UPF0332 family)
MDPQEYLDLAGEWAAGLRQGEWRSCVSRAYYAAFHVTRNLLRHAGFHVPEAHRSHGYLWLRLQNSGHPDIRDAGRRLQRLRGLRNEADYDFDTFFDHVPAVDGVDQAIDVARILRDLQGEPTILSGVVAAIRDYERMIGEETWHGT